MMYLLEDIDDFGAMLSRLHVLYLVHKEQGFIFLPSGYGGFPYGILELMPDHIVYVCKMIMLKIEKKEPIIMRTLPRAPFAETGSCLAPEEPKQRTAEEIVDLALEKLIPEIEECKYMGNATVRILAQANDPVDEMKAEFKKVAEARGYQAFICITPESYHFDLEWDTPFDKLLEVLADDKYSDERRYDEIGTFIYMQDPRFQKVQDGLWTLDLSGCGDGKQRPLDPVALSKRLLDVCEYRAFIDKDILYVFSDEELNKPKKA